jgi:hypothetical protein
LCSSQKSKMPAKQNKGGDVPAHNEYTDGHSHNGAANGIDITQVFGCQEQSIGAKTFHKGAIDHTEHNDPKDQQYLVFSKMQEKELDG